MLTNPPALPFLAMSRYTIYLTQYSGNQHSRGDRNRHMEIFIATRTDPATRAEVGTAFHLTGDATSWLFTVTENLKCINNRYCGRIKLTTVPASPGAVKALEELLRTIPILHNDPRFNCQRWAWSAGLLLREKGYEVDKLANGFQDFLNDMQKAYIDWDEGDD